MSYSTGSYYHSDLKKQGDLRNSFDLLWVTPLWHVAQWVSRAPPHQTLPAFLNLNGMSYKLADLNHRWDVRKTWLANKK